MCTETALHNARNAESRDTVLRCADVAEATGLAEGLEQALAGIDVTASAPGRVAAVPAAWADSRSTEVVAHTLAEAESIQFIRVPGARPQEALPVAGRLAGARLGLSAAALAAATQRLSRRTSSGEPLVRAQLVIGSIADATVKIDLLRRQACLLNRSPSPATAQLVHEQIDRLDWSIAKLFGAAGYTDERWGPALLVSALVADSWTPQAEAQTWN